METAIWIIAAIEIVRALQNAIQLCLSLKANRRMDKAFIGSQAIDRELTRMIAEQAGVPEYCQNCGAHMTKGEND